MDRKRSGGNIMIMEIYLNKEKAKQEGYDVRTLYYAIDQFFKAEGVPKIGHGKYGGGKDQTTFTTFARAFGGFPEIEWFLKVVDEWYWRELGDEKKYRVDCLESYYKYFGKKHSR